MRTLANSETTERTRGRIPDSELAKRERQLLQTARTLFLEHGFDGVTIEALARAARVSPKTMYARYGGKEGVFLAAIAPQSDRLASVIEVMPTSVRQIQNRLTAFGNRLLLVTLSNDGLLTLRLLIGEATRFPNMAQAFYRAGPARGLAALATLFERADAAGIIACGEPREAAELFLGALIGERLRAGLLIDKVPKEVEMQARARAAARMILAAYRSR